MNRQKIIENLLQDMHAIRHKMMIGYTSKNTVDITPSQSFVLRFISENSQTNIKIIAQALHITSSAATQLVDALVEKKYVLRKQHITDRRITTLSLSLNAKKLFKKFKEHRTKKMMTIFDALDDSELQQYAALQKKISDFVTKQ
ncbi:MarR family transcriptional regulator [Candidatus Parcubacteria bacterium]|uniref:HTH marR-type domain-containing protein n=1 Tax=Candidatus Magasanikbacteria bacterium CG10_big_fil_rev_8_21_14_0_10_38_6 TaxID=1974647 RepID=A0A2M6P0R8_9BACT|nr:MarR family transcriptional regulator [Candidatus Parcubacteria bacterium]PIR77315.1 MAG: hypothetical protein COU30_03140 [Candidatus Magasanikbacteria bacterium CG10_big_fil_rev_8_21_14_0_10_38_6]